MIKVTAYGNMNQVLKVKVFNYEPKFSEINRWANRIALKYGSHPGIKIVRELV